MQVIQQSNISNLISIRDFLLQLKQKDYNTTIGAEKSTIGQHIRHILEFYTCLLNSIKTVSYDLRDRDFLLEKDPKKALQVCDTIIQKLESNHSDYTLKVVYQQSFATECCVTSSFSRELVYCFDHTVHHLAIIKPTIKAKLPHIKLPEHFGIAPSTVAYLEKTCAH